MLNHTRSGVTAVPPAVLLTLLLALGLLCGCAGRGGDRVERFAEAVSADGESIAIPGYDTLSFQAGSQSQAVNLQNPPRNACTFVLTLTLEGGEVLWTGEALSPGEAFTRVTLNRALDAGTYPATLHYDCYTIEDSQPLNEAEIQLTIEVH